MDEVENNKFLTVDEVASILRKKERTIREWCYSKTIPHYKIGNSLLFKIEELQDWIDKNCKIEKNVSKHEMNGSINRTKVDSTPPKLTLNY